jgi:hypothetical protein
VRRALLVLVLLGGCAQPTAVQTALDARVSLFQCGGGDDRLLILEPGGVGSWRGDPVTWSSESDEKVDLFYDNEDPRCDVDIVDAAGGVAFQLFCDDGEFSFCSLISVRDEARTEKPGRGAYTCAFTGPDPTVSTVETWRLEPEGRLERRAMVTNEFGEGVVNNAGLWVDAGDELAFFIRGGVIEASLDGSGLEVSGRSCPADEG